MSMLLRPPRPKPLSHSAPRAVLTAGMIAALIATGGGAVATAQPSTTPTGPSSAPQIQQQVPTTVDPCATTTAPTSTTTTPPVSTTATTTPAACTTVPAAPSTTATTSPAAPAAPATTQGTAPSTTAPTAAPTAEPELAPAQLPADPAPVEPVAPTDPELSSKTAEPDPDWTPTEDPKSTIVPGQMRSDREEVPAPFTKEDADRAEIAEARLRTSRSAVACQVYWPSWFNVCGEIRDKYNSLGGPASFLSYPSSGNIVNPGNTGERVTFLNGPIYWSAADGAHPVVNSFLNRWGIHGYEGGWLGYPTTDEILLPDGGRRQEFQQGAIYVAFQNAIGSAIRNGPIRDKWNTIGGNAPGGSFLGYITGDEIGLPDGQGRMARFERGVIYYHPTTGAWPVTGRILDRWAAAGYETSTFRYPTSDQTDNGVTVEQQFQGGKLEAPGANAVELATQNPGTTAQQMIDEATFNAQQRALDVADVILEAVEGGRIEKLVSDPVTGSPILLPFARGAGDVFYADADTVNVNHGHNGIFVSVTETVEALNPTKGVQLTDNQTGNPDGTRRTVYGPKMMWVNTSSGIRANAVFFAFNQVGKDYNSNFAFNKRFVEGSAYNCSSLVWAAYMSGSGGGIDLDQEPGGGEDATPSGIFPNEIVKSDWTTVYQ